MEGVRVCLFACYGAFGRWVLPLFPWVCFYGAITGYLVVVADLEGSNTWRGRMDGWDGWDDGMVGHVTEDGMRDECSGMGGLYDHAMDKWQHLHSV